MKILVVRVEVQPIHLPYLLIRVEMGEIRISLVQVVVLMHLELQDLPTKETEEQVLVEVVTEVVVELVVQRALMDPHEEVEVEEVPLVVEESVGSWWYNK